MTFLQSNLRANQRSFATRAPLAPTNNTGKWSTISKWLMLSGLVCAIGALLTISTLPLKAQESVYFVYLPAVVSAEAEPTPTPQPTPTNTPTPSITATPAPSYQSSESEEQLATLFINDPEQQRKQMRFNPILAEQARKKAEDMANRNYFNHVNPDGHGPNFLVLKAGYPLPDFYDHSDTGNNIESIAAGQPTAQEVWSAWKKSSGHRMHILGEHSFYQEQIDYGFGYAYIPGTKYLHYWVLLTAKAK